MVCDLDLLPAGQGIGGIEDDSIVWSQTGGYLYCRAGVSADLHRNQLYAAIARYQSPNWL